MNNLFIEKYRPSKFEDVVGQEVIVERVKAMTEKQEIPHMLFSGPPGCGKSTILTEFLSIGFLYYWSIVISDIRYM